MKQSPSCLLYNIYSFRVYLIDWSAFITEQCKKKNHHFQSNTSHGILKPQLSTYCVLPAQYKVQHTVTVLLTLPAFSSILDVAYLTTVLHTLSDFTSPYTIHATFVYSSHTSACFMFTKDKFFSKLCNTHSKI